MLRVKAVFFHGNHQHPPHLPCHALRLTVDLHCCRLAHSPESGLSIPTTDTNCVVPSEKLVCKVL